MLKSDLFQLRVVNVVLALEAEQMSAPRIDTYNHQRRKGEPKQERRRKSDDEATKTSNQFGERDSYIKVSTPNIWPFSLACCFASLGQWTIEHCIHRYVCVSTKLHMSTSHFWTVRRSGFRATRAAPEYEILLEVASRWNVKPMCSCRRTLGVSRSVWDAAG